MRVFDLILYNQEADMLDVRISHLEDVVDKFIVLEGTKTFMGKPKSCGLEQRHLDNPKVDYRVFDYDGATGWPAEWAQRNRLFDIVEEYEPADEDIVTVCDCDEIWNPYDIEALQFGWYGWVMKRTVMSAYWRLSDEYTAVGGPWGKRPGTAQQIRSNRYGLPTLRSGWHLSWMGGPEWAANKMREFCHQELMVENPEAFMEENYRVGRSIRGEPLVECDMDRDMPEWVQEGRAPQSWYRRRR